MNYVIGIGNPEEEYGNTRHNAGKILVHALAEKCNAGAWEKSYDHVTLAKTILGEVPVIFALSNTYMNESGQSVKALYKKKEEGIVLVVHDDLDLSIGTFKLSRNKGDGGHNGITSITKALPGEEVLRLRVGISPVDEEGMIRRVPAGEQTEFVLKPFSANEKEKIVALSDTIESLLKVLFTEGVDKAMTLYNR